MLWGIFNFLINKFSVNEVKNKNVVGVYASNE